MKKIDLLSKAIIVLIGSILCINYSIYAQCTARSIIKDCKTNIVDPYKYSGCWMSEFTLDTKYKRIEGHFVAFKGQKYQIVFCSSGSAAGVTINIYDKSIKDADSKKGRKLYDSSKSEGGNLWKFEPTQSGDYFIEYILPPSSNPKKIQTGCVMLLLGTIIETTSN
jgi:hypothetical protein